MRRKSDWEELADLTMRLDELRSQLDAAEDGNKIAMIYALEEAIAETELARTQVLFAPPVRGEEDARLRKDVTAGCTASFTAVKRCNFSAADDSKLGHRAVYVNGASTAACIMPRRQSDPLAWHVPRTRTQWVIALQNRNVRTEPPLCGDTNQLD